MQHEEVLTTIVDATETSQLEVALSHDLQGGQTLTLRRLLWGEGIGWYCQRTLSLSVQEIEELAPALRRLQIKQSVQQGRSAGKVIPFPAVLKRQEQRLLRSFPNLQQEPVHSVTSPPLREKDRETKRARKVSVTSRV